MIKNKFFLRKKINIDITYRCPLMCPNCQRQTRFTSKGLKVPGEDISLENFEKISKHFKRINFCGQVSDPVHHPNFLEILEITRRNNNSVSVHHASAAKPEKWYPKAFKANPNATWWFGIDGLPEDSHKYRVNQDGEKLFRIMLESKKYLKTDPIWQYIIFNYNENDIDYARLLAEKSGVNFMTLLSSRWIGENDPLRPTIDEYSLSLKED